ncbi:MAG: hypothetical protein HQM09_04805 [Candidatus Riflebacteria bacterium]|nr:hypothetical protein [Candidatus Riflebacteria bacterium]
METSKIQELVLSFMDSMGIKRSSVGEGVWLAEIPPSERAFFNGFEQYVFTFDRSLAEKHREYELICEGSYLLKKIIERLASIPKVSRLYSTAAPELPLGGPGAISELRVLTPGKVRYRQQVTFNFKVSFLCDRRQDHIYSALTDPATKDIFLKEGPLDIDMGLFRETPDPEIPIEESDEDMLRLYLQACRVLEKEVATQIAEMRSWSDGQFMQEKSKVIDYLTEQKRELLKKKENVCFHLYFFQKEEEIDKMISDLENEQQRKVQELREKYTLKVEVVLLNAIVLCIPTLGVAVNKMTGKRPIIEGSLPPRLTLTSKERETIAISG